jgi:hypothetical protein
MMMMMMMIMMIMMIMMMVTYTGGWLAAMVMSRLFRFLRLFR